MYTFDSISFNNIFIIYIQFKISDGGTTYISPSLSAAAGSSCHSVMWAAEACLSLQWVNDT